MGACEKLIEQAGRIEAVGWNEVTAVHMAKVAAQNDPAGGYAEADAYRIDATRGRLAFVAFFDDTGRQAATMAYRMEKLPSGGLEFVMVALAGEADAATLAEFDRIVDLARLAQCQSIRFHTRRPALAAIMEADGFYLAEKVYRKALD